ncbi:hypothetical protein ACRRTK_007721 [Alexandromys fortis]
MVRVPQPGGQPAPRPFLLPTRLLGPGPPSAVLSTARSHGRVGAGTVPPPPLPLGAGLPLRPVPSVLSTMPPLSDLCRPPPGQSVT